MRPGIQKWTFSECISCAAGWETLAYRWSARVDDRAYHKRFNMTSAACEREAVFAAEMAQTWYNRARAAQ